MIALVLVQNEQKRSEVQAGVLVETVQRELAMIVRAQEETVQEGEETALQEETLVVEDVLVVLQEETTKVTEDRQVQEDQDRQVQEEEALLEVQAVLQEAEVVLVNL